MEVEDRYA
jgi:ABC-type multidrug transport system fused ATPase/permease subunit